MVALKGVVASKELIETHYGHLHGKPFQKELVK